MFLNNVVLCTVNYLVVLNEQKNDWNPLFLKSYESNIESDIGSIAKFKIINDVGSHFNLLTGINTNKAESLNNLIPLVMKKVRRPVDVVNLS